MRCEGCRELLSPFMDGMCSEKENKLIEAHLAACSSCREQLEEMRRMVEVMHQLTLPSLPEGFTESLHRRLDAENLIIFPPHEFKVPKKQSWIAAAVAGVALAGGIYASTVLPLGSMIANWQDKNHDAGKPQVAINDFIDSITHQNKTDVTDKNAVGNNTPKADDTKPADTPGKTTAVDNAKNGTTEANNNTNTSGQAETLLASSTTVIIKATNASDSRQQLVKMADANNLAYSFNNNGAFQAMSAATTRGVTLKVDPQDVDKVIQQMAALGQVSNPAQNTVDLSDKLADVQTKLDEAQAEKDNLAKAGICQEEQARLNELNTKINSLTAEKAQVEKEAKLVTINVYFMEDVNP